MNRRRALVLAVATPLAVLTPMQAWAYFAVGSGTVNASASVSALGTPTASGSQAVSLSPVGTPATIKVTAAPSSGPTPTSYRVDRISPSPVTGVCTITGSTGSCKDPSASGSATNQYSVVPLFDNWIGTAPAHVNTKFVPDTFAISGIPASVTAGESFQATITAKSLGITTDASFTGTQSLNFTGSAVAASPSGATATVPATADFIGGVATVNLTLVKAGLLETLTVGDANGMASGTALVTVKSAALAALTLSGSATVAVNTSTGALTLKATDAFSNAYSGSATVVWSGATGSPTYPATAVTFLNGTALTPLTAKFDTAQTVGLVATIGTVASNAVTITVS